MITVPHHKDWEFDNDDFTVETWIKIPDATPSASHTIFATGGEVGGSPSDISGWQLHVRGDGTAHTGRIYFTAADPSNDPYSYLISPQYVTLTDNQWGHIAVVREGKEITMYLDGVSVASNASFNFQIGKGICDNGNLSIGKEERDNDRYMNGQLDEMRISKIARYTYQGLVDSAYPNPSSEFDIQTESSTYGRFDTQITAGSEYKRYNYQHHDGIMATDFNGTAIKLDTGVTPRALVGNSADFTVCAWLNPQDVTGNEAFCGALESSTSERFYFRVEDSVWSYGYGAATTNSGTATNTASCL